MKVPSAHSLQVLICTCSERSSRFQRVSPSAIACGSSVGVRVQYEPATRTGSVPASSWAIRSSNTQRESSLVAPTIVPASK